MTGIEMIAQERQEQIEKHGYTPETDQQYQYHELRTLAMYCLLEANDANRDDLEEYLFTDEGGCRFPLSLRDSLLMKPEVERLAVAGAFIAAEIDRIKNQQ